MMKIIVSIFSIYQLSFGNRLLLYGGFQAPPQPQQLPVPPQQPVFPAIPGVPIQSPPAQPAQPIFPWQQYPHIAGLDWNDDADYGDMNNFYGTGGMPQSPAMEGMIIDPYEYETLVRFWHRLREELRTPEDDVMNLEAMIRQLEEQSIMEIGQDKQQWLSALIESTMEEEREQSLQELLERMKVIEKMREKEGLRPQMPGMAGMPQANNLVPPDLYNLDDLDAVMRVIYQSRETEIHRIAEEQAARLRERFSGMASAARLMEIATIWQGEQDRIYRELRERWYREQVEPLIQRFDDGVKEAILAELTTHSQQLLEELREQQLREKQDQLSAFMESIIEKEKVKDLPPQTL